MGDLIRREYASIPDPAVRIQRTADYQWAPEDDSLDIRRYFQVLLKRKWLITAVVGTVLLLVAIQSFTTTPLYRATARVQIDPEAANILPYQTVQESAERYLASEIYLQTELEILRSRALARRVVDRLNLANDPRFRVPVREGLVTSQLHWFKRAISSLRPRGSDARRGLRAESRPGAEANRAVLDTFSDRLEVEQVPNSRLVEIRWVSPDPTLAATVSDTLAEEFIEQNLQTKFEANTRATEFLKKQLQEMKARVERSEQELVKYARENNIVNIGPDRGSIVLQTLEDLNRQLTGVEGELIGKTAEYEAVKDATPEDFPQSLRTPSIALLEERLFGLQQNLASLSAQFREEWPAVIQVRKQIQEVEQQLKREKKETINRVRSEYRVAVNRRQMLKNALNRQKAEANQLNQDSIQYSILQREVDTNRQLYEGLLQRLKETGVAAGMRTSNIHVVDRAEVPDAPYSPQRAADLALGFGVGLFLAIGLAFLMEYLDNTLKTPEEMEQSLGLPSLGVIPTMADLPAGSSRLLAARNDPGGSRSELPARVTPTRFRVWEAYRSLRTSILLSHSGKPPKVVMVTSSLPGEGKTTTVANTGIVLAQTGARTLLIDLDMRKPALATTFGYNGNQGISAYLSGNGDLSSQIRQTNYPNLFLLPAGFRPPNPAELIGSERMETALRLLGDYFKYILIDTPPVLSVTDGLLLSPHVDGVVLVIKGGATPKEAARKAGNHLLSVGARILGALINSVDMDAPEYAYYYRNYFDEQYNDDLSSAAGPAGAA
ncbi:MAG: GumC family protein [Acidobacteriota bacterium]